LTQHVNPDGGKLGGWRDDAIIRAARILPQAQIMGTTAFPAMTVSTTPVSSSYTASQVLTSGSNF
jgi:hypothetical protein